MKIICKVIAGSHLFGTNTPESDLDYKGVYIPDAHDILMGTYRHTITQSTGSQDSKNTSEDVDLELYSLKKFFDMVYSANNHVLEILFAPREMIVETSPEWEYILEHRDQLVCREVKSYIQYCNSQAAKYGVKGSRVRAVEVVMSILADQIRRSRAGLRLKSVWPELLEGTQGVEFISFHDPCEEDKQPVPYLKVVDRRFQDTVTTEHAYNALVKIFNNYGKRALQAKSNEGIDWKAISHAYRVGVQAYELLETGHITLPIKQPHRDYLITLKKNKDRLHIPFDAVRPVLEELADNLQEAVKASSLRDKVDEEFWNGYVADTYAKTVTQFYTGDQL